jgi:hypothetical protein
MHTCLLACICRHVERLANSDNPTHGQVPNRITVGVETTVEVSGAMPSEQHSFVGFRLFSMYSWIRQQITLGTCMSANHHTDKHDSVRVFFSLANQCDQPVHVYPLRSRVISVNLSSTALTEVCYTTG